MDKKIQDGDAASEKIVTLGQLISQRDACRIQQACVTHPEQKRPVSQNQDLESLVTEPVV
jgi:hypothetical protein